jgi:hypothetical protein
MFATIFVCPPNRDQLAAKPTREAAAEQLLELVDMLRDDARWTGIPDPSDVEDKLQDVAAMMGVCCDQLESYIKQLPLWTMESDLTSLAGELRPDARVFVDILTNKSVTCMFGIKLKDLPELAAKLTAKAH